MKGYIKVGAFLVVILATILWLGGFLSKKERLKAVEQQSQIVSGLGFAKAQEINTYTYHSGQIVADKRLEISTKIPGRVLSVNVEQSQQVSKGQSLLNIDPGEIIAQARAFEYQKVQSEKLELSLRAQLEEAQKTYDRYSSLLKEGAITQQEFDQIKSRLESIKAQVEQSRAMQESAKSQKMAVESNLSYTNLSSPISGVVVSKNVDAGDMAMPGQVLMVIESGPYMFETYLPESLYGKLKIEQDYQIKIPSLNKDLRAKIVEISAHIDPVSKTFKVKLKPQEQEGLKSGMYAKLLIPSEKTQVAIPLAAVVKKFDFDAVWVLKEDKTLELRVVRLGELEGDMVLVQSGLKAGEIVVTSGKEKACQGCKVRE